MIVSMISGDNGDAGFGLAISGTGDDDEATFELSSYDAFGRLVSVLDDNNTAEYAYNADGLRISKDVTTGGVTESARFLYEGGYITLELDGAGDQSAYNVYGGESIITRTTAQGVDFYLYNGRGDVVQLADQWGIVSVTYDYDAFGNLRETLLSDSNPFRYCGEYWDYETKKYNLRARYYNPATGRFTQRDSFLGFYTDPLSLNQYLYCSHNPIRYRDPWGDWQQSDENLNKDAQVKILMLTIAYYEVSTAEERAKIEAEAAKIRSDPNSQMYYAGTNLKVDTLVEYNQDTLNAYMNKAIKNGVEIDGNVAKQALTSIVKATDVKTTSAASSAPPRTSIVNGTPVQVATTTTTTSASIGKVDYAVTSSTSTKTTTKGTSTIQASISIKVTAHYSVYIFYNPIWADQMEQNAEYIAEYYGIDISDIGTVSTPPDASGEEFTSAWNAIGTTSNGGNVKAVVNFNHADPKGIESISNEQIQLLEGKSFIENVVLLGCNAGHLDYIGDNPASYFAEKINGKVMASDGTMYSDTDKRYGADYIGKYPGHQYWDSVNDSGFKLWIVKSPSFFHHPYLTLRDNAGFVIYQKVNGSIQTTLTGYKRLSVCEMLDFML